MGKSVQPRVLILHPPPTHSRLLISIEKAHCHCDSIIIVVDLRHHSLVDLFIEDLGYLAVQRGLLGHDVCVVQCEGRTQCPLSFFFDSSGSGAEGHWKVTGRSLVPAASQGAGRNTPVRLG